MDDLMQGATLKEKALSISFKAFLGACRKDPLLLEMIQSGQYVFINSHLCLNHSKYVLWDATGKPRLTQYAETHIQACCFMLDPTPVQSPRNLKSPEITKGSESKARRSKYTASYSYSYSGSSRLYALLASFMVDSSYIYNDNRNELIKEYNNSMLDIMKTLPMNFSGALDTLIKWADMTEDALAEASALSEKTIQRLRNNEPHKVSLETVIQLCIGMKLPPPLSNCLLRASGNNFMMTELHVMYQFLLGTCYYKSIDECNYYLIKQGFKPLGRQVKE